MNYYSPEQVKAAVAAGLISPQDAEYMLQEQRAGYMAGHGGTLYMDRDAALRLLVDPATPKEMKARAFKDIERFDEMNPPSEEKYGAGFPWGTWAGAGIGALGGGFAAGKQAKKVANRYFNNTAPGTYKDRIGNLLSGPNGGMTLGGVGNLIGGGVGATVGSYIAPAKRSPYEDPLGA